MSDYPSRAKFGQRGLYPIGTGAPEGTRCLQLNIPDSDAALAMLFGALGTLTRWKNYERDPEHIAKDWTAAWLSAIRASFPLQGCGMSIEFMQDDCGLYFREIGAETWTQIYDGLHCLESDGARSFFDGIIGDYIDKLIDDGTLATGGGQPGPSNNPPLATCNTYHVQLTGNQKWRLPVPLQYGDTLQVLNQKGGWNDGTLRWYCPDGHRYLLDHCAMDQYDIEPTDPMPAQYHMGLIMNVNGTWNIAPGQTSYQYTAGTSPVDVFFQANDASLSDNAGQISFDVQYCRSGTIQIAYYDGGMVGPTQCQVGDTIQMTGRYDPYGACGHFSIIWAKFDQPVKLTVVSINGWLGACDPSNSMYAFNNSANWDFPSGVCAGYGCADPTGIVADPCRQFWVDSHTSGGNVVVQVKIEAPG